MMALNRREGTVVAGFQSSNAPQVLRSARPGIKILPGKTSVSLEPPPGGLNSDLRPLFVDYNIYVSAVHRMAETFDLLSGSQF